METLAYDHGILLRGTQLWFDAERRRQLCVVCSLHRALPPLHRRVLAPAPLAGALTDAGYAGEVLPLPWGRWVGVGGHRLQLVPMGAALGQACTLVETPAARVLLAGSLTRPDTVWNALGPSPVPRWPQATAVVVRLPALGHVGLPLAQVALQVAAETCETARLGLRPTILVESVAVGWALWEALSDLGLNPRPLGLLRKVLGRRALPAHGLNAPGRFRPPGPSIDLGRSDQPFKAGHIRIDTGLGTWAPPQAGEAHPIALAWYADLAALQALLNATGAHTLYALDMAPARVAILGQALGPRLRVAALSAPMQPSVELPFAAVAGPGDGVLPRHSVAAAATFERAPRGVLTESHESTAQRPSRRHRGAAAPRSP